MARVVLDCDTGTDDAGAILLAATDPRFSLEAMLATWGNCSRDCAARNTLAVLGGAGRDDVVVHTGADAASGPAPVVVGAEIVMGADGLGGVGIDEPPRSPSAEPAAEALVRLTHDSPGVLTLVALAPLSTIAGALALDPSLPARLADVVVMGGAFGIGGNVTAAAEANIGHDPIAAAAVFDAFGGPAALASGRPPRLVPLDVTVPSALTRRELDAVAASRLPGASLLHEVWDAIWSTGLLETGWPDVWPAHDLLATWCVVEPDVCTWVRAPLAVDLGGGAAWGATVADHRRARYAAWTSAAPPEGGWLVATEVDVDRFHAGVRTWLAGGRG